MPAYNLLFVLMLIFSLMQIQLKGNMNCSSKDIVLALGVSGNGRTTLSPEQLVQTYDWLLKHPFCVHIHVFCSVLFCLSIYIRCQKGPKGVQVQRFLPVRNVSIFSGTHSSL